MLVRDDEAARLAAGADGTEVGEHVDRAADRAVAGAGAAAGLHASVHRPRDDDHLVRPATGVERLPLTELAQHHSVLVTAAARLCIVVDVTPTASIHSANSRRSSN